MSKRKKYRLCNRRFQVKYIVSFLAISLLGVVSSAFLMLHDINAQFEMYINQPAIDISSTGEIVLPVVIRDSLATSIILFAVLLAMSAHYYYQTSRIARNLDDCLDKLGNGVLDFCPNIGYGVDFGSMEDTFNNMLEANRERLARLKNGSDALKSGIDSLEASAGDGPGPAEDIDALRKTISEMDEVLSWYKL